MMRYFIVLFAFLVTGCTTIPASDVDARQYVNYDGIEEARNVVIRADGSVELVK